MTTPSFDAKKTSQPFDSTEISPISIENISIEEYSPDQRSQVLISDERQNQWQEHYTSSER